jgi:hypothetical protein
LYIIYFIQIYRVLFVLTGQIKNVLAVTELVHIPLSFFHSLFSWSSFSSFPSHSTHPGHGGAQLGLADPAPAERRGRILTFLEISPANHPQLCLQFSAIHCLRRVHSPAERQYWHEKCRSWQPGKKHHICICSCTLYYGRNSPRDSTGA